MANMHKDRSAFEDQWQEAFENAETAPSEGLWKNIDNQLTMQENGKYRRGFIFYRSLAAACVVCLLGLGYFVIQDRLIGTDSMLGQQVESPSPETAENSRPEIAGQKTDRTAAPNAKSSQQERGIAEIRDNLNNKDNSLALRQQKEASAIASDNAVSKETGAGKVPTTNKQEQPARPIASSFQSDNNAVFGMTGEESTHTALNTLAYLAAQGPDTDQGPLSVDWISGIDRLYRVPQLVVVDEEEKQPPRGLFAGINLATNYFDPNFSQGGGGGLFNAAADESVDYMAIRQLSESSLAMSDSYNNQITNSGIENRPQLSISYGVDVGVMLSKRLSLESGIDYGRMNSRTSTQLVAEDFSQGERIPLLVTNAQGLQATNNSAQFTPQEQQLTNSFDIISVPLKLGYNFDFRRFNVVLSSGMAANFFLNNRLSDDNGQLNTVNQSASSANSPFRSLYYSAVFSGGLNYKLTENYALSVTPNYNLALSDLTESGYNFTSQPNNFGIDFGLRYVFQ